MKKTVILLSVLLIGSLCFSVFLLNELKISKEGSCEFTSYWTRYVERTDEESFNAKEFYDADKASASNFMEITGMSAEQFEDYVNNYDKYSLIELDITITNNSDVAIDNIKAAAPENSSYWVMSDSMDPFTFKLEPKEQTKRTVVIVLKNLDSLSDTDMRNIKVVLKGSLDGEGAVWLFKEKKSYISTISGWSQK